MLLNAVLYGLLCIGLLFVSIEEISWGQRILNIEAPKYFWQHNLQQEITFHNMMEMSKLHNIYILVGAYGAFAWIFARLFLSRVKNNYRNVIKFIVPDWFLSLYFFPLFSLYIMLEYIYPPRSWTFLAWRDQEPVELLLSLGFLSFVVINYFRLKRMCLKYVYGVNVGDTLGSSRRMIKPEKLPAPTQIEAWMGKEAHLYWERVINMIEQLYPNVFTREWFFGGKKHGLSLRYKRGKLFCELIPEKMRFVLQVVFGVEECLQVEAMRNQLLPQTMKCFDEAKTYSHGKWLLLTIDSDKTVSDVKKLFAIKRKQKR